MTYSYLYIKTSFLTGIAARIVLLTMLCLAYANLSAKQNPALSSPNGKIVFSLEQKNNSIYYKVSLNKIPVIQESILGLEFKTFKFLDNIKIVKSEKGSGIEAYDLITGKSKHVKDVFNRLAITVKQITVPFHQLTIHIEAFNNAVAFRYEIPRWQEYHKQRYQY
ncbi:MAG: glycoside hydrolase family 97 N-terminal domain-containing protein [Niabella sp.]